MPLTKVQIRPGFNKQVTATGAEGQWTDGDFVRFRYGLPEKIGGWEQITTKTLVGAARDQLVWADLDGRRYAAIGTSKTLLIYFEGAFYDITPLDTAITGATFTTANTSPTVTVNKIAHGLSAGDLFTFTSVTPPTGAGYTAADFTTNTFEVVTTPSQDTFTITMAANAGTTVAASGAATINPYVVVGPLNQTAGFGYGTSGWGGSSGVISTLNGLLQDDTAGTGGSGTSITLSSVVGFPTSGTIKVGTEFISYTGISTNDLTGITRGVAGTRTAHSTGASVEVYLGWGSASLTGGVVLESASWSLDHFGSKLIATIKDGKTFEWDTISTVPAALTTRATVVSGAPTKSVMSIVSERDRHLIILGTETTIGTSSTQDKMFIRFSDQENISDYTPTSINTAGTFRIDSGTKIVGAVRGKDYILILTDTSAYVMQFVGPPFTFSIRQVGSNCGAIGQHAMQYANGAVWWMGQAGGFFVYDGTVKSVPCLVEDFVFTTGGDNLGLSYANGEQIYAGANHLYSEINWFYPKNGSELIDRVVTYNYSEQTWTTGSLSRTTYFDATLFDNPYATEFSSTGTPTFPTIQGVTTANGATTYYAHEIGNDQVDGTGVPTAIPAFIQSGDFDLAVDGDGQVFMSMRRFVPDFKLLTGDAQVTINLRDYPTDTAASSPLGPFTITSSTDKIDTRARSRFASLKVANTSTGQSWRFGTFRADVQPDGMRG
jgi:hypothetical protein|tara:strand:+ start:8437 stop:10590 length:2154 start_codon:yes stop_codon:yes gene_type:complete